ncbi:MAG: protein-L-isoaspartate(D-aspartate) O-methyltransferase [Gemmatimonadota bacterium]
MRLFRGRRTDERRADMIENQIRRRGIADERVLAAMGAVPRHLFVPAARVDAAYSDHALPIGYGATISQPYIVALMTSLLRPQPGLRVLEVGTGSGYQAAVLAACECEVYTVERIPELLEAARVALLTTGWIDRVHLRLGDGSRGWPEEAPFDRTLLTAAASVVPPALFAQLAIGGLLVAPIGEPALQTICRYRKDEAGTTCEAIEGARFVPLIEDAHEEA